MKWKALKRFCEGTPEYGLNAPASEYIAEGLRLIRTTDIALGGRLTAAERGVFVDASVVSPRHALEVDDLLFSRSGSLGQCLRVRPEMLPATFAGYLVRFRPLSGVEPRYLAYCAESLFFQDAVRADAVTSTISNLNAERYANLRLPDADLDRQRAIADYLDTETTRIDTLITKKRQLIELLDERYQGVIRHGVCGLLVGDGERVASTMPWMSDRPSRWDEVMLKLVAKLGTGHTPSREHPEWWTDCTIPWITTGEVAQMRSDRLEHLASTREMISELGVANSSAVVHPTGTVVLCRTASAGYSAIMASPMATSQDFVTWTCGPLLRPRFLLLCLRAMRDDLLGRLAMGSTHKTIYMPDIESIRVPLPPVDEQDAIVEAVWGRLNAIGAAVDRLHEQIGLLVEHRQSLITAAVTGELVLPGVAA